MRSYQRFLSTSLIVVALPSLHLWATRWYRVTQEGKVPLLIA